MNKDKFMKCQLCPRNCSCDRTNGETGFCGETETVRIARAALHEWEEPFISGEKGSGTVFFSGCNLRCIFCQNREIALSNRGTSLTIKELAEVMLGLQKEGAHNINLVTAGHFAPAVVRTLLLAKEKGLTIPIVYNTSGYETVETIQCLRGLVDIYLPDFKYMDPVMAGNYSHAPDYPEVAKAAIAEMFSQTGPILCGENGLLQKGVVIRHLVLPLGVKNACEVIDYLYDTYGDTVYLSIMNQFTPVCTQDKFPQLNRRVTKREYEKVLSHAISRGVTNAFFQEGETAKESFIPDFNLG